MFQKGNCYRRYKYFLENSLTSCLVQKRGLSILLATKMKKITLLFVLLSKVSGYVKNVEDGKMLWSFFIRDEILVKYIEIWSKIKNFIERRKIDSK